MNGLFAASDTDAQIRLSEKFLTQPLNDPCQLTITKQANNWQLDLLDTPSAEAPFDIVQKIDLLFREVRKNGCAAFWKSNLKAVPTVPTTIISKNLLTIGAFCNKNSSDLAPENDLLIDQLLKELAKQPDPQNYLGPIPPDIEYVVGKGLNQKRFYAHRSVLCYYEYWSSAFSSNMVETKKGLFKQPEVDPDNFETMLHWIYTGMVSCEWPKQEVEGSEISAKIFELQQTARLAETLMLPELYEGCLRRVAQLTEFLKRSNELDREKRSMQAIPIPATYCTSAVKNPCRINPANNDRFYDVSFKCHGTLIQGNGPLLALRSPFFRELLSGPLRDLPPSLPLAFCKKWIRSLHEGDLSGSTLLTAVDETQIWTILQFAHSQHLTSLARFCSEKAFTGVVGTSFSPEQARQIHSLTIRKGWTEAERKLMHPLTHLSELIVEPEVPLELEPLLKQHGAHLKALRIPKCPMFNMDLLKRYCPNLQKISLVNCEWLSNEHVQMLVSHFPRLQIFNLTGCPQLSGDTIEMIARGCPLLRKLCLSSSKKVTDQHLESLFHCPQLQELVLTNCNQLTGTTLEKLALNCPQLRKVYLKGCSSFTDQTLAMFAAHCPKLEILDLSNCTKVTSQSIEQLALHCPNLQRLCLNGCIHVTDTTVKKIATHCRQLAVINLNNCLEITGDCLEILAKSCTNLREVSLNGCIHVTNKAIETLAENCPHLQVLCVVGCEQIKDSAVEKLIANCPELQIYNFVGCTGISSEAKQKIENFVTHVK